MEATTRNIFLLSLLFLLAGAMVNGQTQDYQISYLSVDDGLSQNEVTSILQDKYGFMWFGTRGGLNRYDGYVFKHYKPGTDKESSLSNPSIERLYQDKEGNIWIGTKSGGYSVYNLATEKFHSLRHQHSIPNRIVAFQQGLNASTWIGGWTGGLWEYNAQTDTVAHWLGNSRVNTLVQTSDSTLWCGTNSGLRYAKEGSPFRTLDLLPGYNEITKIVIDKQSDSSMWLVGWELNLVHFNYKNLSYKQYKLPWEKSNLSPKAYSLMQDSSGTIWVGTWGNGLYRFNAADEVFEPVNIKPINISGTTIDYDVILDIFEDNEGNIWIGTDGGGVVRLSAKSRFNTVARKIENKGQKRHVNAVLLDDEKHLWVGTKGSGVFVSKGQSKLQKVGFLPSDRLYQKKGLIVKTIYKDANDVIWISFNEGLYVVEQKADGSFYLISAALKFKSPELRQIRKALGILVVKDELWVSTQQSGLYLFKQKDSGFTFKKQFIASNAPGQLNVNRITTLLLDDEKNMWVGTYKGLYQYKSADSTFINVNELIDGEVLPLCDIILSTWIDTDKNLWFGTPCSLNKLRKKGNGRYQLTDYSRLDGLSDDYINGILDDDKGNIWVSTNAGISKFDIENETFINYDSSDGVGGSNFSESACYKSNDGVLFFGGFSDLTFFHPDSILTNQNDPSVVITDFKILNKAVEIGANSILEKSINEQKSITLNHRQTEFSFELASLDYNAPDRNQYAYWLEGSDEGLVNIGTRRHISFNNLKPGDYILHLKGTNRNGVWTDKERTIAITVLPAPWRTWYAVVVYVILILVVVVLITSFTRKQERLVNAAEMQKVLREKEHQINEYKFKFFTNISHELRTPLTLIMAPLNELMSKDISTVSSDFISGKIQLVQQHSTRLYNLVNQLLEFRKAEAGKIKIQASEQDIVAFVNNYCKAFDELAALKKISFKKKLKLKAPLLFFDGERLGVVLNNLLSNAFKFAGEPGDVQISLSENASEVMMHIKNNGKGISKSEMTHLFERFYQVPGGRSVGSSGIGLALVKNYVELHKGSIEVDSEPDTFTTFTVRLKKGKAHFADDEISDVLREPEKVVLQPSLQSLVKTRSLNVGTKGASVVIVEDNSEVRNYIAELLADEYNVIEAVDGIEGYDLVIEHKPQLVLSDVMMPRMDGFELCQKIKSNDTVSHIPVLLLTAKGTPQDQLFGARKGADAYLTKPFEPELLMENVRLLIASRKRLSDKFSHKVVLEPTDAVIQSEDGKFLEQAIKIIEKNMSNTGFDPEKLASELAMSTSTFYRKIKKLTEKTPGEFIKHIRLKRAAQLLKETNLTVSEIIESVGYQDIKNFRRNFKQEYHVTPSDYRKA